MVAPVIAPLAKSNEKDESLEGLLAFGTDEGRVGWVEALSSSRVPNLSNTQHRNGVYR